MEDKMMMFTTTIMMIGENEFKDLNDQGSSWL